jgi:LPPG:FO 2-phospho-L-lactate transferase
MGMPDWFQLGDTDLATHILRTARLDEGLTLSQITHDLCMKMGVDIKVLPMSDDIIQTRIFSDEGDLAFQEYFVHRKCTPVVNRIEFTGIENSKPAHGVLEAIRSAEAVIVCPSNPWVSIDPILTVPGIRAKLKNHFILAVSPIIGGQTIKGPAAKMFYEMGIVPSAFAVAQHYSDLIDCLMIDKRDENLKEEINNLGIRTYVTDIVMHDEADRGRLANEIINLIEGLERVSQ